MVLLFDAEKKKKNHKISHNQKFRGKEHNFPKGRNIIII